MNDDRPLGMVSDEFARLREHIDARLERTEDKVDRRIAQTEGRVEARFAEQGSDIKALTEQVSITNGSVRALQIWKARVEGQMSGVGGSWGVIVGGVGMAVGVGGVVLALATR